MFEGTFGAISASTEMSEAGGFLTILTFQALDISAFHSAQGGMIAENIQIRGGGLSSKKLQRVGMMREHSEHSS